MIMGWNYLKASQIYLATSTALHSLLLTVNSTLENTTCHAVIRQTRFAAFFPIKSQPKTMDLAVSQDDATHLYNS